MSAEIGIRLEEELQGLPFQEEPSLPPEDDGRCLSIAEIIRATRTQRSLNPQQEHRNRED